MAGCFGRGGPRVRDGARLRALSLARLRSARVPEYVRCALYLRRRSHEGFASVGIEFIDALRSLLERLRLCFRARGRVRLCRLLCWSFDGRHENRVNDLLRCVKLST